KPPAPVIVHPTLVDSEHHHSLHDKRRQHRPHHSVAHHGSRNSSATATINALLGRVAENAATPAAFGKRATFRPKQRVVPRPDLTPFWQPHEAYPSLG